MGRFVSIGSAILAIACVGWAINHWIDAQSVSAPLGVDLEITPKTLVFDSVPYRGSASRDITLTNRAKYVIHVNNVATSCGCLEMLHRQATLQPGETVKLSVRVRGSTTAAQDGGQVIVYSNSATNSSHEVKVVVSEVRGITTIPESVEFGKVSPDKLPITLPFKVALNSVPEADRPQIRVTSASPRIEVQTMKPDEFGDAIYALRISPSDTVGHFQSELSVEVPGFDRLTVPVIGVFDSPVRAFPPTLLISRGGTKQIRIRDESGAAVPVRSAECSDSLKDWIRVQPEGNTLEFSTIDPPDAPGGVVLGTVEVVTENPEVKLVIPATLIRGR